MREVLINDLQITIQILYNVSAKRQGDESQQGFSLKLAPAIMDSLLQSLIEGKSCSIEMEKTGDGDNGVLFVFHSLKQTIHIDDKSYPIVHTQNPYVTEVAGLNETKDMFEYVLCELCE